MSSREMGSKAADEKPLKKRTVVSVVLLGCGGVGSQLLKRILDARALHDRMGLHVAVVAVADSEGMVVRKKEFDDALIQSIIAAKTSKSGKTYLGQLTLADDCEHRVIGKDEDTLQALQSWDVPLVVVDCTASETGRLLGLAALQGFCIVLANKKPITSSLDVYDQIISNGRHFRCESTVGAGLPVMCTLARTLAAGDPIHRIVGALSGTLGYVMSGLQDGRPYSEVVASAKSLGYTEPDPRDDLSGMDVARKALIMARAMGWRIDMKDVEVESLYPSEMAPRVMSTEEFLSNGIATLNSKMQGKVEAAQGKNSVLRYVATIEDNRCKVGLMEVSQDSPLGTLRGSDNLVEVYTDCYKVLPLVIRGAGAGNDTTAAGVLADIIDLQDLFNI